MASEQVTTLRDYQARAVRDVDSAWLTSRSVLLVLPTGAGKGTIAAHVLREETARGGRPLLLVHREEIVRDVARRVGGGDAATLVGGVLDSPPGARVLCASVQSLTSTRLEWDPTLILTDEAHHAVAATYRALYARYPSLRHLGLTATPMRSDKVRLDETYDELVVGPSPAELRDAGWLVPCDVVSPHAYASVLSDDPAAAWRKWAGNRPTIVFTSTVDEAHALAARWPASAAVISESTKGRADILQRFKAGELTTLINVHVLTEGTDLPNAEVCVLARGCGAPGTYLQMIGRVLRPSPGKKRALVIDLKGLVHAHGLPYEDRVYSLSGKPIRRADKALALSTCKHCFMVFQSGPLLCPHCHTAQPKPPPPKVKRQALGFNVASVPEEDKARKWRNWVSRYPYRQAFMIYKNTFGHSPREVT
tara:strand:+ start:1926 stop:3191 length:1266 start_codon:yes stop_codon:yes gene_type:complete